MKQLYKHNHIPTQHLTGDRDYVPFKARSEDEKGRRRGRLPGHLLAEQELRGFAVLDEALMLAPDTRSRRYLAHHGALALVNTDWNLRVRHGRTMYKPVNLAMLAIGEAEQRPTAAGTYDHALVMLGAVMRVSAGHVVSYERRARDIARHRAVLGRYAGNAAQTLAAVEIADEVREFSPVQTQIYVRERSMDVMAEARTIGNVVGADPTVAQFADRHSHYMGYIQRTAPDGAIAAVDAALGKFEMPR